MTGPKKDSRLPPRRAIAALAALALCGSAHALRPFQGTDAAVAEPGTFELEAGVSEVRIAHQRLFAIPELVGNWGVGSGTEVVLEGKLTNDRLPRFFTHDTGLTDSALSVKHVWVPGVLQDARGFSVATECGVLLPEINGTSRTGASCAGIASNRWQDVELHFNAGIARTRQQSTAKEFSVIAEAPEEWKFRPVFEAASSRDNAGGRSRTMLAGMIVRVREDVAFDVALRAGNSSEGHVEEVRAGLTWSVGPAN